MVMQKSFLFFCFPWMVYTRIFCLLMLLISHLTYAQPCCSETGGTVTLTDVVCDCGPNNFVAVATSGDISLSNCEINAANIIIDAFGDIKLDFTTILDATGGDITITSAGVLLDNISLISQNCFVDGNSKGILVMFSSVTSTNTIQFDGQATNLGVALPGVAIDTSIFTYNHLEISGVGLEDHGLQIIDTELYGNSLKFTGTTSFNNRDGVVLEHNTGLSDPLWSYNNAEIAGFVTGSARGAGITISGTPTDRPMFTGITNMRGEVSNPNILGIGIRTINVKPVVSGGLFVTAIGKSNGISIQNGFLFNDVDALIGIISGCNAADISGGVTITNSEIETAISFDSTFTSGCLSGTTLIRSDTFYTIINSIVDVQMIAGSADPGQDCVVMDLSGSIISRSGSSVSLNGVLDTQEPTSVTGILLGTLESAGNEDLVTLNVSLTYPGANGFDFNGPSDLTNYEIIALVDHGGIAPVPVRQQINGGNLLDTSVTVTLFDFTPDTDNVARGIYFNFPGGSVNRCEFTVTMHGSFIGAVGIYVDSFITFKETRLNGTLIELGDGIIRDSKAIEFKRIFTDILLTAGGEISCFNICQDNYGIFVENTGLDGEMSGTVSLVGKIIGNGIGGTAVYCGGTVHHGSIIFLNIDGTVSAEVADSIGVHFAAIFSGNGFRTLDFLASAGTGALISSTELIVQSLSVDAVGEVAININAGSIELAQGNLKGVSTSDSGIVAGNTEFTVYPNRARFCSLNFTGSSTANAFDDISFGFVQFILFGCDVRFNGDVNSGFFDSMSPTQEESTIFFNGIGLRGDIFLNHTGVTVFSSYIFASKIDITDTVMGCGDISTSRSESNSIGRVIPQCDSQFEELLISLPRVDISGISSGTGFSTLRIDSAELTFSGNVETIDSLEIEANTFSLNEECNEISVVAGTIMNSDIVIQGSTNFTAISRLNFLDSTIRSGNIAFNGIGTDGGITFTRCNVTENLSGTNFLSFELGTHRFEDSRAECLVQFKAGTIVQCDNAIFQKAQIFGSTGIPARIVLLPGEDDSVWFNDLEASGFVIMSQEIINASSYGKFYVNSFGGSGILNVFVDFVPVGNLNLLPGDRIPLLQNAQFLSPRHMTLIDFTTGVEIEDHQLLTFDSYAVVSDYEDISGAQQSFFIYANHLPVGQDDEVQLQCIGEICSACVDVLFNDSDLDSSDVLTPVLQETSGFTVNGGIVCYTGPQRSSVLYNVHDNVGGISEDVTLSFSIPEFASSTPTISASNTPAETPTISTSNSETKSESKSETPSISVTAKESLVIVPPLPEILNSISVSVSILKPSMAVTAILSRSRSPQNPSASLLCDGCDSGEIVVDIQTEDQQSEQPQGILLETQNSQIVGELSFQGISPEGVLHVSYETNVQSPDNVGTTIVSITISDEFGIPVTSLPDELEICITKGGQDSDDYECLGFYNEEKNRWECEDKCLKERRDLLCGTTDHLTSFALLLGGTNSNGCGGDSGEFVIAWISLSFVVVAIIFIVIGVLGVEISIRVKKAKEESRMQVLVENITAAQSPH